MKGILRSSHFRVVSLCNPCGLEAWRTPLRKRLLKNGLYHPRKRLKPSRKQADEETVELEDIGVTTEDAEKGLGKDATEESESRIGRKIKQALDANDAVGEESENDAALTEVPKVDESDKSESENMNVKEKGAAETAMDDNKSEQNDTETSKEGSPFSKPCPIDSSLACHDVQMQEDRAIYSETVSKSRSEHDWNSESILRAEGLVEGRNQSCLSIPPTSYVEYKEGGAIVCVMWGDFVVFDGCASVSVLKGRASMEGFLLRNGVEMKISSNFKLSSALTIQPYKQENIAEEDCAVPQDLGLGYSDSETTTNSEFYKLGCMLHFRSENTLQVSTLPDCNRDFPESERSTFRVDIRAEKENDWRAFRKRFDDEKSHENRLPEAEGYQQEEPAVITDLSTPIGRIRQAGDSLESSAAKPYAESMGSRLQPTRIPSSWQAAAHAIASKERQSEGGSRVEGAPIVVICGAKGTGKSTCSRYLVNELLNTHNSVGYLDTDAGQPEFTISGCLSLHILQEPIIGSPILHLRTPEKFFYYGDISPKGDPTQYIACIQDLYECFVCKYHNNREQGEQVPLVINTHGWLKGVGMDVLSSILRISKPTHLIRLVSSATQKNIPSGRFWQTDGDNSVATEIISIDSYTHSSNAASCSSIHGSSHRWGKNASELRALRILTYFQNCHGGKPLLSPDRETDLYAETAIALACQFPYEVSLSDIEILYLHSEVSESQSLHSINAELVCLASSPKTTTLDGTVLLPECIGFGIVRGVDVRQNILYLVTPLPLDKLQFVDIILDGRVQVPVQLVQEEGFLCPYSCGNSVVVEGAGSAVMRNRKRAIEPQMKVSV